MGKLFVLPPETFERLDQLMESLVAKDGAQQKIQPVSGRDEDPFIVVDGEGTCSGSCAGIFRQLNHRSDADLFHLARASKLILSNSLDYEKRSIPRLQSSNSI